MDCNDVLKDVRDEVLKLMEESEAVDREVAFYIMKRGDKRIIENICWGTDCMVLPRFPDYGTGDELIAALHTHPREKTLSLSAGDIADPDIVQCVLMPKTGEMKCVQWNGTGEDPRDRADRELRFVLEARYAKTPRDIDFISDVLKNFDKGTEKVIKKHYEVVCQGKVKP